LRYSLNSHLIAALTIVALLGGVARAEVVAAAASGTAATEAALSDLDLWIGEEANGQKWRKFLATAALRQQLTLGSEADPGRVSQVLQKYCSGAKGLEKAKFAKVREELAAWLKTLKAPYYADDLSKLAWASRGDYDPASLEGRLAELRAEMRNRAQQLESTLGTDSEFAQSWKQYLRWENLEPHLSDEVKITREQLANLDRVLKRFRANRPGLELPVFLQTTEAISDYRALFAWHELVKQVGSRSRKKYKPADLQRRVYIAQLQGLQKALTQHQEAATVGTTATIGETLGLLEQLQQSPQMVAAIRGRFVQPNVLAHLSQSAIDQFARRPVGESQQVRDVILGAQIRGTADTTGELTFTTEPAGDHVALKATIVGNIQSNTKAYKKPVVVTSRGNTAFVSTAKVLISDDQFLTLPACTSASTDNTVCSICKTGGDFGRRLIEKIAWKKVRESKSQSEVIAARKAEKKVSAKFDKQVGEAIYQARQNYDEKFRMPLIRTGMFPEQMDFSSTGDAIKIQTMLASHEQISTPAAAMEFEETSDFSLKIHETAVNNFLPLLLGGLEVQQDSEAEPPQIKGDVPHWLKKLANEKSEARLTTLNEEKSSDDKPAEQPQEEQEAAVASEFKPFKLTLNQDHPLSVSFDDQQIHIRISLAEMKTIENGEETLREGWDFLVSFSLVQEGNQVKLRRSGEVEMFPTGFDPRWDTKLTGEQVATRGALAKILKKRASDGNGFPEEISLPEIKIPRPDNTEIVPILQQLHCDEGWLALSYQLPE
jgi:hypothetical protein